MWDMDWVQSYLWVFGFLPPPAGHEAHPFACICLFLSLVKKCKRTLRKNWTTSAVVLTKCDLQPTAAEAVRGSIKTSSTIFMYTPEQAVFSTVCASMWSSTIWRSVTSWLEGTRRKPLDLTRIRPVAGRSELLRLSTQLEHLSEENFFATYPAR